MYLLDNVRIEKLHKKVKGVDVGPLSVESERGSVKVDPSMSGVKATFTIKF